MTVNLYGSTLHNKRSHSQIFLETLFWHLSTLPDSFHRSTACTLLYCLRYFCPVPIVPLVPLGPLEHCSSSQFATSCISVWIVEFWWIGSTISSSLLLNPLDSHPLNSKSLFELCTPVLYNSAASSCHLVSCARAQHDDGSSTQSTLARTSFFKLDKPATGHSSATQDRVEILFVLIRNYSAAVWAAFNLSFFLTLSSFKLAS